MGCLQLHRRVRCQTKSQLAPIAPPPSKQNKELLIEDICINAAMTEARKAEEKTLRPLRKNSYELAMESTTKLAIDEPQDIHKNGQADLLPDGDAEAEEE